MPRRRTILKVLLLLAAGATLNVAVAWGLVARPIPANTPFNQLFVRSSGKGVPPTILLKRVGELQVSQTVLNARGPYHPPALTVVDDREYRGMLPWSSRFFDAEPATRFVPPHGDDFGWCRYAERFTGWPVLSLRCHRVVLWPGGSLANVVETSGIDLSRGSTSQDVYALPVWPVLPGFAVNTLFYAGVLWVLCCGPFALRRMIRCRRGQCSHCAYPIGQSPVCTECGAAHAT